MNKSVIGVNAGKVWHAMEELKEATLPELAQKLDLSIGDVALAVGWLAREDKICILHKEGETKLYQEGHFEMWFG